MMKTRRNRTKTRYVFDPIQIADLFLRPEFLRSANVLALADSVFEIEKVFRAGGTIRNASIPAFKPKAFGYDLKALSEILRELLIFVLSEDVSITLRTAGAVELARKDVPPFTKTQSVCLFSGGLDSYAGILLAKARLKNVAGIFAAHADQGRIINIVRKLEKRILTKAKIELHELKVPSVEAHGYAQLRGFLYIVGAAAWMNVLEADTLFVTECGPTMYQPRFSPFDSITMTTHPVVVDSARRVIGEILGRKIAVLTPFEDLTKAEVFAVCPEKAGLRHTHSCISQRFGRHDGTCYGCVVRRLAGIAAGVADVHYDRNPIADRNAHAGNLMSLLTFCHDLLTDYPNMDWFEVETIQTYSKQDLFRRFALDNYAAIHRLIQRGQRVRLPIVKLHDSVIKSVGKGALTARLKQLERARFAVSFK
jgi:7-cyano-7-deazaguanine synthase in queuosine biosynthesis